MAGRISDPNNGKDETALCLSSGNEKYYSQTFLLKDVPGKNGSAMCLRVIQKTRYLLTHGNFPKVIFIVVLVYYNEQP